MRRLILCLVVAAAGTVGFARGAAAYPQFQFSSGTNKCSQCHFSPAGTGLISSWGRSESGDTISMAGDGAFLHGAVNLPSWLALGADFRGATTRTTDGGTESPQGAIFPMQADLYARFAFGDAFSLYLEDGVRGEVRAVDPSVGGRISTVPDRLISREHYFMWRPSATGPYARVGRFFAPYGLRFAEHVYFVRRYTGFNLYEETYTASGGYVADEWELHVSLFTPPPSSFPDMLSSVGPRESGGAGYFEYRINGMAALGAQARFGVGKDASRYQGGAIGKLWIDKAKLLFLGEADLIRQQVSSASFGTNQFVAYAGVSAFPVRGVMLSAAYERFQEDLAVSTTARNAYDGQINLFPYAHCEVLLLGRYIKVGEAGQPAASLLMLQLHYYL
jgi:hypothetical protein